MKTFKHFSIRFPAPLKGYEAQDAECLILSLEDSERTIRLHDYPQIYRVPGLYEHIFRSRLKYSSPEVVTDLLVHEMDKASNEVSDLNVLEIGAGNGIAGELLKQHNIKSITGTDIIPEAAAAAQRDRPHVYADYHVGDFQDLPAATERQLQFNGFNCLFTVGALGFKDIPPRAFARAFNFISHKGWIAFNIKEDFTEQGDSTGFSTLLSRMTEGKALEIRCRHRYRHRLSINGKPLYYVAIIGRKHHDIADEIF